MIASAFKVLAFAAFLWRSQHLPAERVRASQLRLLRRQVASASESVPLYRETIGETGKGALRTITDFHEVPLLSKDTVKAAFPDRLVASPLKWDKLYAEATSGTHDRIMVFHDETKRNWDRAADLLLALSENGFRPGHCSFSFPPDACAEVCGAEHGRDEPGLHRAVLRFFRASSNEKKELGRRLRRRMVRDYFWREQVVPSLSRYGTAAPPEMLEDQWKQLEEGRPSMLKGYPVALHILARHGLANNKKLSGVRMVRPSGGKFSRVMAEAVSKAFTAPIRENYGTGELGTIGFDCPENPQQHLLGELFYLEFLRHGRPVGPGELGEIVVTDLRNDASPLIRYRIGDVGRYFEGPCRCGFSGTLFSVEGRLSETIVTKDGSAVSGNNLIDRILLHPEIAFAKVVQKSEELFLIDLVPASAEAAVPSDQVLERDISSLLKAPVSVKSRRVRTIAAEGSGKYKLVISNSFDRFHSEAKTFESSESLCLT